MSLLWRAGCCWLWSWSATSLCGSHAYIGADKTLNVCMCHFGLCCGGEYCIVYLALQAHPQPHLEIRLRAWGTEVSTLELPILATR